jgi:hypothetical protein
VRSALECAVAKAMAADGVTKSEIARRLGDQQADGSEVGRGVGAAKLFAGAGGIDARSAASSPTAPRWGTGTRTRRAYARETGFGTRDRLLEGETEPSTALQGTCI